MRFFLSPIPSGPAALLEGSEAHHLLHVLRIPAGGRVEVFDGAGQWAECEVLRPGRRSVELRILQRHVTPDPAGPQVTLAVAAPKGERLDWLVEKTTELGVARLIPLNTERSVVEPGPGKLERLRQTIIAACKQSGRTRLMELHAPLDWGALVEREVSASHSLLADPEGACWQQSSLATTRDGSRPILAIVGPEGGLTAAERDSAVSAGAHLVSLGPRILRIETAGLLLVSLCQSWAN